MAFPRPTDFEPGDPDHAAEHNRINEHLNLLHQSDLNRDTLWLRSTGFPTMAAPVGTRYTDTAATNGAVEWIKASGTGSSGWQVSYGDTGWQVFASWGNGAMTKGTLGTDWEPYALSQGGIYLRRQGNRVSLQVLGIKVKAISPDPMVTIPVGFRPTRTVRFAHEGYSASHSVRWAALHVLSYGVIGRGSNTSLGVGDYWVESSAEYVTSDPWPSALP